MSEFEEFSRDLVLANRILASENIVDAYGHVSVRSPTNPERFLLSRSKAPELVKAEDILEYRLDGELVEPGTSSQYVERFIHAAVYEARPDVQAVVHAHAEDVLPFTVTTEVPLRPVIHSGSFVGAHVPVWDIADAFGHDTNLLVLNMTHGRDLATCLGANNVALMRGHGFTAAARSLFEAVRMSIYLARNARALQRAVQLGGTIKYLSESEIAARDVTYRSYGSATWRAWEYWATRAGCRDLLGPPPAAHTDRNQTR